MHDILCSHYSVLVLVREATLRPGSQKDRVTHQTPPPPPPRPFLSLSYFERVNRCISNKWRVFTHRITSASFLQPTLPWKLHSMHTKAPLPLHWLPHNHNFSPQLSKFYENNLLLFFFFTLSLSFSFSVTQAHNRPAFFGLCCVYPFQLDWPAPLIPLIMNADSRLFCILHPNSTSSIDQI